MVTVDPASEPITRYDEVDWDLVEPPPPRWAPAVLAAVAVLVVSAVVAGLLPSGTYGFSPGSAQSIEARIRVEGATTYPDDDGEVLFTTVSVRRLSALERAVAAVDPDTDVVPEESYLGGRTPTEARADARRQMGASKETAQYVALTRLGYEVVIRSDGVVVTQVAPEVPAASVLEAGDQITEVDGTPVPTPEALRAALAARRPGETVVLTVRRGDRTRADAVVLSERDGRAVIGIGVALPADATFEFPFEVEIDTGGIGGPSAGLAFTLALLDRLTPGDLTGGRQVAATGSIDVNGNVGRIGGIRQKVIAADRAGAEVFLVPAEELDEARRAAAGRRVTVEGVATIDDALAAIGRAGGDVEALGPAATAR